MSKYGFDVWYMKPEFWLEGGAGGVAHADPANLNKTHVSLRFVVVDSDTPENAREEVFRVQQGEVWSPNGEARELIQSKGLHHTSMSVGDVLVDEADNVFEVQSFGFGKLGEINNAG